MYAGYFASTPCIVEKCPLWTDHTFPLSHSKLALPWTLYWNLTCADRSVHLERSPSTGDFWHAPLLCERYSNYVKLLTNLLRSFVDSLIRWSVDPFIRSSVDPLIRWPVHSLCETPFVHCVKHCAFIVYNTVLSLCATPFFHCVQHCSFIVCNTVLSCRCSRRRHHRLVLYFLILYCLVFSCLVFCCLLLSSFFPEVSLLVPQQ